MVVPGLDVEADRAEGVDREVFERLYRQWRSDVVVLCRRLLGTSHDAEDAAQEAFLRAWLARDRYSPVLPFWPWMATIARRLCVDERRRHGLERSHEATAAMVLDLTDSAPEHVVEAGDDLRTVARILDDLRPLERRVLVRRQVHGWSYRQIALDEGVTVEAVRGSLKRGRASLRLLLSDQLSGVVFAGGAPEQQLTAGPTREKTVKSS